MTDNSQLLCELSFNKNFKTTLRFDIFMNKSNHSFLPLDDNFLVLIIFAAYSTLVSLCIHRRTMLNAPLRAKNAEKNSKCTLTSTENCPTIILTFLVLLLVRKSREMPVSRPVENCPPCLKSTQLCYSRQ